MLMLMLMLYRLKLKTIVSLIPEAPICDLQEFCLHERVHLIPIKVAKYNEKVTLTQPLVAQILEVGSLLAGN